MIPLIDLSPDKISQNKIKRVLLEIFDSKSYILGPRLESFEKKFAKFIGSRYAIGVASGTDAIRLALRSLDISKGDRVLTVSFTSPFTVIAIIEEGAIPIFCDVDEKTWTIDIADAERKIDKNVKAIIPVHIYGNPCGMESILKFAKKHGIYVIEDACQAHGAEIGKRKIGTFGDAAAFSFYPTKNLGGIGDGGIVTTNNPKIAKAVKLLRHGGQTKRFWHVISGINSRLDELQAGVLEIKLQSLERNNFLRSKIASKYRKEFSKLPIKFQETLNYAKSANHLFVIRVKRRDVLRRFLLKGGIFSDIYYPTPVHLQPAFKKYSVGKLKVTEMLSRELLALPLFPNLLIRDQNRVISKMKEFFS